MRAVATVAVLFLVASCATGAGRSRQARRVDDQPLPQATADLVEPGPGAALLPSDRPSDDPLLRRMASAHRARGRGRPASTALVRGELGVGQEQGFTVRLEASTCYTILAVGESRDVDVDLLLLGEGGAEVAADRSGESVAAVEICPPAPALYRAVVRMYAGQGAFAIQVFGS